MPAKRFLFAILLLLSGSIVNAAVVDSLEFLKIECRDKIESYDYGNLKAPAYRLRELARSRGDNEKLAYGEMAIGIYNLFNNDVSQAPAHLTKAADIARAHGLDSIEALSLNSLAIYEGMANKHLHLSQRLFFRALKKSEQTSMRRLEGSIYNNLAQTYLLLNDTVGIKYARKCFEIGKSENIATIEYMGAQMLAEFEYLKGNLAEASKWLDIARANCEKYGIKRMAHIYLLNGKIKRDSAQWLEAGADILRAISLFNESEQLYLSNALYELGLLYSKQGRLKESNESLEDAVTKSRLYKSYEKIPDIYYLLANNYSRIGDYATAFSYQKLAQDSTRSHADQDRARVESEIDLLMEIADKEIKISEQQKNAEAAEYRISVMRYSIWILSILIAISAAFIIYIIRARRKQARLIKALVAQNIQKERLEEEIETIQIAGDSYKEERIWDDKSRDIFSEAIQLMKEKSLFKDPKFTREEFLQMLDTNHTYLTKIIRERSGMNFSQWVNSFRIREAIRLMSDEEHADLSIQDIYKMSGFGSSAPFYKLFQKTTGLTPSEFRKQSLNA